MQHLLALVLLSGTITYPHSLRVHVTLHRFEISHEFTNTYEIRLQMELKTRRITYNLSEMLEAIPRSVRLQSRCQWSETREHSPEQYQIFFQPKLRPTSLVLDTTRLFQKFYLSLQKFNLTLQNLKFFSQILISGSHPADRLLGTPQSAVLGLLRSRSPESREYLGSRPRLAG